MPIIIQTAADGTPIGIQILNQRSDPHPQGDTLIQNYKAFATALFPVGTALKNSDKFVAILENNEGLPVGEQVKRLVELADKLGLDVRLVGGQQPANDPPPPPKQLIVIFRDP